MRRGKRFLENDNLFIYLGTAIFFILAIALGIIMYMLSKTTTKLENGSSQVAQETKVEENTESVSTEIGKTVEEQKNNSVNEGSSNIGNQVNSNTNIQNNATSSNTTNSNTASSNTASNISTNNSATSKETNASVKEIDEPDTNVDANSQKDNTITETKKEITFVKPAEGEIICEFAKDNLIYSETLKEWITHTAIDIKADKTSVIKASADGVIKSIVNDPRYGLTVVIEHDDGYETVYSNLLTAEFVVEGEEVTQGQTIGTAGNTASFESSMECHLHFELLKDGEYLDPTIYLK